MTSFHAIVSHTLYFNTAQRVLNRYKPTSLLLMSITLIYMCCACCPDWLPLPTQSAWANPAIETIVEDQMLSPVTLVLASSEKDGPNADDHAPIGVMGDHTHKKGEWMLSYRYMYMRMSGMRSGGQNLSKQQVHRDYMVTPTTMDMHMHMLGGMYSPHDKVTLMAMVPIIQQEMNHETRMGTTFKTRSWGVGDTRLSALIPILQKDHHEVVVNPGISIPTGSINQRDNTPMGDNRKLPYPMQLGSGTYDLIPSITYRGKHGKIGWGVQTGGTIRLGRNDEQYRLGNRAHLTPWVSYQPAKGISTSLRLKGQTWGHVRGEDADLNSNVVPTANPQSLSGKRVDLIAGINFLKPSGIFKNHRLAVEFGVPIYQNLDGPQLETDFYVTAGWQWSVK